MHTHTDSVNAQQSRAAANELLQKQGSEESTTAFVDMRPEAIAQRQLKEQINRSAQLTSTAGKPTPLRLPAEQAIQQQPKQPPETSTNTTGLSDTLKTGIEHLSGYSLDDVKVHYNSSKPTQLQAHAYAQGTDIHVAAGQEKHLPHEAWHVVQQKQGRVKPTMQLQDALGSRGAVVHVNDDAGLEKEADVMGNKALQLKSKEQDGSRTQPQQAKAANFDTLQRAVVVTKTKGKNKQPVEVTFLESDVRNGGILIEGKRYNVKGFLKKGVLITGQVSFFRKTIKVEESAHEHKEYKEKALEAQKNEMDAEKKETDEAKAAIAECSLEWASSYNTHSADKDADSKVIGDLGSGPLKAWAGRQLAAAAKMTIARGAGRNRGDIIKVAIGQGENLIGERIGSTLSIFHIGPGEGTSLRAEAARGRDGDRRGGRDRRRSRSRHHDKSRSRRRRSRSRSRARRHDKSRSRSRRRRRRSSSRD